MFHPLPADRRVERPAFVWLAIVLEVFTAVGAIPVGLMMISDPTGAAIGLPAAWIESSVFGSYLLPGVYLLLVNGIGMLVLAGLSVLRHRYAPWMTGVLGTGLVIWIGVQVLVLPELSPLQAIFGATGIVLAAISVAWLRHTGQLRLW